ncbi:cuticle protein 8-like [Achroia grisella]|uniref:cuticle protein 8-like n=1 Tax=Achroia grisella TaxID=688607 RepID=UPI0027D29B4E|nr:cuticle protein 8-like [Achroia grisella]
MIFVSFQKALYLAALVVATLGQYEELSGYENHEFDGYHAHKPVLHQQHQRLDGHHEEFDLDYHAHPKYSFDYSVKDPHTGDDKEHWETRDGDKVKGTYTLLETDGTKRVVEYEADDKNGFNAVVHKIGTPKEHHEPEFKAPIAIQEYKVPLHKYGPVTYQHEFQAEEGFVPISGGFEH